MGGSYSAVSSSGFNCHGFISYGFSWRIQVTVSSVKVSSDGFISYSLKRRFQVTVSSDGFSSDGFKQCLPDDWPVSAAPSWSSPPARAGRRRA